MSVPRVPPPTPVDEAVLLLLPLSVLLLVVIAFSPTVRDRLGSGMSLGLSCLAAPLALTYLAVIAFGHGF